MKDSTYIIFGRNYDFDYGDGFIAINPRGIKKRAIIHGPYQPAMWISKFGSITFNQIGIQAPMGGMNEKGLVIAQMALPQSEYPEIKEKPVVNQLEWIQYQLDMSASLEEVIENLNKIAIMPIATPVHYLICDSEGNAGIIEFLNGRTVILQGKDIRIPVCSNDTYNQSMKMLKHYRTFGGQKEIPEQWTDVSDIIAVAATSITSFKAEKNEDPVTYGFNILKKVGSHERTQWSTIYDIKNQNVYFVSQNNHNIRSINLKKIDFSYMSGIKVSFINDESRQENGKLDFQTFSKESYYRYKMKLINWYATHIAGFPGIPESLIRKEVNQVIRPLSSERP